MSQTQLLEQKITHLETMMDQKFTNLDDKLQEKFTSLKETSEILNTSIQKTNSSIENLKVIIEEKDKKLSDPKDGVYVRLERLELWKSGISKWLWMMAVAILGLIGAVVKKFLIG